MVPIAGLIMVGVLTLAHSRETRSQQAEEAFIIGNPSRYRSPETPAKAIEPSGDTDRCASLWMRNVESRAAVESLTELRSHDDPFTSLYASGALETQMGYLESRISKLRSQVSAYPDDKRLRQHLAEALIHLVELRDPNIETGEGAKALNEASSLFSSLGVQSKELEKRHWLQVSEQRIKQSAWQDIASEIPSFAPLSVRNFWCAS